MILCLNLNAAIDKTIVVKSLEINQIHHPLSTVALAGGKGCNVARALKTLGGVPVVSGWVGGFAGKYIELELHREGIQTDFIYTDYESRTCTSIIDQENQTITEIYESGESVPAGKIAQLRKHFQANIRNYQAVTLSGSLPPGVPASFYTDLVEIARAAGVMTFLDTSGVALRSGVVARPYFIKPNLSEALSLLELESNFPWDGSTLASELSKKYKVNVLLSLGPAGAIAAGGQETYTVKSPKVEAKSAVGSGDCMLAGLVYGLTSGSSFEEAVLFGVAAGTANTLTVGAGRYQIEDFNRLLDQIYPAG